MNGKIAHISQAREFDKNGQLKEAYELYLISIEEQEALLDDYINFSILAFVFQDYGITTSHNIPNKLIERSWKDMYDSLDKAQKRFGNSIKIDFWKKYFRMILQGGPSFDNDCLIYIDSGFIEAYIGIQFENRDTEKLQAVRNKLMKEVDDQNCTKNCYLRSLLQ